MKILIIDDEEMIRVIARKILERDGYEVLTAESGIAGLEILSAQPDDIELVLLDFVMDDMSGEDTLRRIRQVSYDIPCIVSSGHIIDQKDLPEGLRDNVRILQKPYQARVLSNMVKNMLSRDRVNAE
ncbi:MAG: response regulator [candidate division Zixibacteria bacterium]|nr:response regulator [candidate division Zixibacteria bacterium]